jgi:uncharacterized protein YbjT (DUF2867 family)
MNKRTALVFGSTGLVGSLLLEELIHSDIYSGIKIFVRKTTGISDPKVEEILTDYSVPDLFSQKIKGDDLFICIGTTIKKAGSVSNMEKIDRDLPLKIAAIASANGVKRIAVVSSIGANFHSGNYYLRIKGEMEVGILKSKFEQFAFVRPSMLLGNRKERRIGESIGKVLIIAFKWLLSGRFKKYRGIYARDVAKAMIYILQLKSSRHFYESDELQKLADQY